MINPVTVQELSRENEQFKSAAREGNQTKLRRAPVLFTDNAHGKPDETAKIHHPVRLEILSVHVAGEQQAGSVAAQSDRAARAHRVRRHETVSRARAVDRHRAQIESSLIADSSLTCVQASWSKMPR